MPCYERPRAGLLWLLEPALGTSLLVVDSKEDWSELVQEFPHRYENSKIPAQPHWSQIRARAAEGRLRFDALHLTERAVADRSLEFARTWQVESTLWLSWCFGEPCLAGEVRDNGDFVPA